MSEKQPPPTPYISIPETARYLGMTTRGIRIMIADGRLKAYRLGPRIIRLKVDEVDAAFTPIDAAG